VVAGWCWWWQGGAGGGRVVAINVAMLMVVVVLLLLWQWLRGGGGGGHVGGGGNCHCCCHCHGRHDCGPSMVSRAQIQLTTESTHQLEGQGRALWQGPNVAHHRGHSHPEEWSQ